MRHGGSHLNQYCLQHFDAEQNLDLPFTNADVDSELTFHFDVKIHFWASESSMAPLLASMAPLQASKIPGWACVTMLIQIRIRIQLHKIIEIHAELDPQHQS